MASHDKLIRWIDLIAALLRRRFPVSFEELARDVPEYAQAGTATESLKRKFERDKDDLRRAGIAIETVAGGDGEPSLYRLRPQAFYLPYLVMRGAERALVRPDGPGYAQLPTLALAPEEAAMLRRAAERVMRLGAPPLTEDATSALRKLRYDLPDDLAAPPERDAAAAAGTDGQAFERVVDAVERGKRVTFTYRSMGRDATASRTVDPYGLVFVTGHWYLVARDAAAGGVRLFRTTRMHDVAVNAAAPATRDFTVPADFDLKAHARSRQAWELGTGDSEVIDVRFTGHGGDVTAALRLGEPLAAPLDAGPSPHVTVRRRFRVRRRDTFLRWLLSFAGDARPEGPSEVVQAWRTLVRESLDAHRRAPEGA